MINIKEIANDFVKKHKDFYIEKLTENSCEITDKNFTIKLDCKWDKWAGEDSIFISIYTQGKICNLNSDFEIRRRLFTSELKELNKGKEIIFDFMEIALSILKKIKTIGEL